MTGAPQVRTAVPADAAFIARANAAMALETEDKHLDPDTLLAGVTGALADPLKGRYFVAELDGRPAGCLLLTTEWSDWRNGWFWWIQSVYVEPAARRRGVFRALFEAAREAARAAPEVCGIRLYVERENERAMRTYANLGMHETVYRLFEIAT